jgi:hypothetical protein
MNFEVGNASTTLFALNSIAASSTSTGSSQFDGILEVINAPQEPQAGAEVSLQLNSTSVSFADLSAAGTGWGLALKHPNGTETNLGMMQASSTMAGPSGTIYSWVTQTPVRLTQVRTVS